MLERGSGTILFTGASASVKGYAQSASFAMGKFALRGLAQSMARELGPRGIHVAHVVIEGGIGLAHRPPSPTPTSTSSASRAAPGRTRSTCGRGSSASDMRSLSTA